MDRDEELAKLIEEQRKDDTDFQRPEFRDTISLDAFLENFDEEGIANLGRGGAMLHWRDVAELNRINAADAARQPLAKARRRERDGSTPRPIGRQRHGSGQTCYHERRPEKCDACRAYRRARVR
jgi:hypothetical protein